MSIGTMFFESVNFVSPYLSLYFAGRLTRPLHNYARLRSHRAIDNRPYIWLLCVAYFVRPQIA